MSRARVAGPGGGAGPAAPSAGPARRPRTGVRAPTPRLCKGARLPAGPGDGKRGGGGVGGWHWLPGPWSRGSALQPRAPRARTPPCGSPRPEAGRRRGREVPACIRGAGVSAPLAGAAQPGGEVQGVPARREGGAVWPAPAAERGGGPGKSLGACQEHSAHNNLAENTAASASRNPGLAQSPAGRASPGPTQCTHQPWGFSLSSSQVPALSHHP